MAATVQQTSRKAELEAKIKALEDEKVFLQQEVARLKEALATAALEKKAQELEQEVTQLKSVKTKLEGQLSASQRQEASRPQVNTGQTPSAQKQSGSQNPPVRYGTWSKLPLS